MRALVLFILLALAAPLWAEHEMKTYSSTAKGAKVTVVHFGAPWCGPCKVMEPDWQTFQKDYKQKVNIVSINVDEDTPENKKYGELAKAFGGIPYTVWLDSNGKVLQKAEGLVGKDVLVRQTEAAVKAAK